MTLPKQKSKNFLKHGLEVFQQCMVEQAVHRDWLVTRAGTESCFIWARPHLS